MNTEERDRLLSLETRVATLEGKQSHGKFQKPTIDELAEYAKSIGFTSFDPQAFLDHYDSNGWKVGKVAMKVWKAAVRTWKRSETKATPASRGKCCYRCGSNIGDDGRIKIIWKENKPWNSLSCFDRWVREGRPKYD
jgi:hypothetical protein